MGLLAGDVLEGFGEKLHPTGWPLEKGQDFNNRDVLVWRPFHVRAKAQVEVGGLRVCHLVVRVPVCG